MVAKVAVGKMKKTSWYVRFMSGFLAVWLLVLATGGRAFSTAKPTAPKETTSKTDQKPTQEAPTVQTISLEAVVSPALFFDFSPVFYFLPSTFSFEYQTVALPKCFAVFYFYFSFFRHVFGTYIAINAP